MCIYQVDLICKNLMEFLTGFMVNDSAPFRSFGGNVGLFGDFPPYNLLNLVVCV